MSWLFRVAYTCSGFAGLVYQVCWTRLLTLYIGHSTAAASAVVAAFLGGLAAGAAVGGSAAVRLTRRQSLIAYGALEIAVAVTALVLPIELRLLTPALASTYDDGAPGLLFPIVRLLACALLVFIPAMALGASFPMAIRWFATNPANRATPASGLYALNTTGAAIGALLAGFTLIPRLGISGTTLVGVVASTVAAAAALWLLRGEANPTDTPAVAHHVRRIRRAKAQRSQVVVTATEKHWLAAVALGLSGFAALVHEIAWTRILTMVLGPTVYAFAATLTAVIGGVALGSALGAWTAARSRRPAFWLSIALAAGAMTAIATYSLVGGPIPGMVARHMATSPDMFAELLWQGGLMTTALIVPTAACLGAAFPLALAMIDNPARSAPRQFGSVYALNTAGAVVGSLVTGFQLIPAVGLEGTLKVVSGCLIAAALLVATAASLKRPARLIAVATSVAAAGLIAVSPAWDRALLASGVYMYAPFVPKGVDVETLLRAGTLLYYREGAAATVSVKRLTGTTTLAVDGKTDASNRSDMLTQKLVAHLPLLLHEQPRDVAIIGLGSGVTLGSALTHPVDRVDVLEISPEVVEASQHFVTENRNALADPRTNVIVTDGRSHLWLSRRRYDVIVSEPSNPWIAGVAALFTREFFEAARDRLAPGGVICQWANAYNISDADLRSIIATFRTVFPHGTAWLVGADDVVLVASDGPLDHRLAGIGRHLSRPGVIDDLNLVGAVEPFSLWSLYVAGPDELRHYARDAAVLDDDRMALEFSAPRELHGRGAGENGAILSALLGSDGGPRVIRDARKNAGAAEWRHRGAMMSKRDAHAAAYDSYVKALTLDLNDRDALDGLVRAAVITKRGSDALGWLKTLTAGRSVTVPVLVAQSKLLASIGAGTDALQVALDAGQVQPLEPAALEQLASLHADAGETAQLGQVVERLRAVAPDSASTHYYAAVWSFLRGEATDALQRGQAAIAIDPQFAAAYDLIGAAYTKLGQADRAREAFIASLTFDAHDSTAYANLGLLELAQGDRAAALNFFAEALWLDPDSPLARQGLNVVLARGR